MTHRHFQAAAALIFLAGCGTIPPDTAIRHPLTAAPVAQAPSQDNLGAIFQPANGSARPLSGLFEDRRPRYVGDTLTVLLVENTNAARTANTTEERKANATVSVGSPQVLGYTDILGATSLSSAYQNKQEFKDNSVNNNRISGSITVTVVEVLANGNLRVAGEKQVAINSDTEYVRVAGVVSPTQITAANTINSTQLADAQMESKNSQGVDKSQIFSLLSRFFVTVLPF
ncbi:MAG: flagellar basal body L-ring protein FlgH [Betaproteobacteria bacterium]|nr:flagellar basal body L-ring protein FlgH [Betaproteobacteria bacterium]